MYQWFLLIVWAQKTSWNRSFEGFDWLCSVQSKEYWLAIVTIPIKTMLLLSQRERSAKFGCHIHLKANLAKMVRFSSICRTSVRQLPLIESSRRLPKTNCLRPICPPSFFCWQKWPSVSNSFPSWWFYQESSELLILFSRSLQLPSIFFTLNWTHQSQTNNSTLRFPDIDILSAQTTKN